MDAREQLRRYLEQRREMGETELVLDTLGVDDALRLLGARTVARDNERPAPRDEARSNASARAAGAEARTSFDRSPGESSQTLKPVAGGSDWREALRAAGASPGVLPSNAPSANPSGVRKPSLESTDAAADAAAAPAVESISLLTLDAIAKEIAACKRCPLYETATNPVPGEGNPHADLMCVGEAPGATEDETGRPFVGAAGQLLTKILEAIQLPREQVYICNVLKHRPPGNRNPLPEEVVACSPFLIRQIELVKPKVILALGSFAAQTLLQSKLSLGKLRGQIHQYHGVPVIVTYHPAALLRNPSWKRPTWEDVQLARRTLDAAAQSGA